MHQASACEHRTCVLSEEHVV